MDRRILYYRIAILVIVSLVALMVFNLGKGSVVNQVQYKDRVIYKDSIRVIEKRIEAKEKVVTKFVDKVSVLKETKIIYDTIACKEIVDLKDSIIRNQDTIIMYKDTIIRDVKEIVLYKDRIIEIKPPKRKWNISISGGYGTIDGQQFNPFIGITIGRTLINF